MWNEVNDVEDGVSSHDAIVPMCPIDVRETPDRVTILFSNIRRILGIVKIVQNGRLEGVRMNGGRSWPLKLENYHTGGKPDRPRG